MHVNARQASSNETPLMVADNAAVIEYLIGKGAEIDAQNREGFTALMFAVNKGNFAVKKGNKDAVEVLVKHHANLTLKNNKGEDALTMAEQALTEEPESPDRQKIVEILKGRSEKNK